MRQRPGESAVKQCGRRRQKFVTDAFAKAGHPLTLAQSGWISPADLMHMRIGDVSAFKPETQLQYVGHLKPGIYIKAGRFVGLTQ